MHTRTKTYNRQVLFKNLNNVLAELRISKSSLAETIGITETSFYNKLKGKQTWKFTELIIIQKEINKVADKHYTLDYLFEV